MSLSELSSAEPVFGIHWDADASISAEVRTQIARRAAITRRARAYVDYYLAETVTDISDRRRVLSEDSADDIAFGRCDCDFLFRD